MIKLESIFLKSQKKYNKIYMIIKVKAPTTGMLVHYVAREGLQTVEGLQVT